MYAPEKQKPDAEAPCAMHNCSHLCVPVQKPNGFIAQCLCRDEYTLSTDGTCKPTPTSKGAMYVYALVDRICAMPIKKLMKKNLKEIPDSFCFFNHSSKGYKFRAVDFNYREGEIYFSEFGTSVKTIRRARLEKKSVNSVLVYGTGDVRGLVVDWMTSNMYWTDATAGAIWVSRLGGQYMRKIVTDISNPGAVALDMQTKRLLWTESRDNQSRIMVAKLDGSQPSTFVSVTINGSNSTFTSLTVDYVEERIYWVDPSGNSIWSASLIDGSGQKKQDLVTRPGKIYGVTVMQDFVGFTESSTSGSSIHVAEKDSGRELRPRGITHDSRHAAYDIVAYYRGNQPLLLGTIFIFKTWLNSFS
ncbi:hypothetical protein NP493_299g02011 [Ridgeia piscesae]|uniref:Low-density lipoprotein receptor repeat class B n=1 Tax=Ridgeia piscesae TaxID=27915 RepID=A0AAD9L5S7_RIDPI|nr:hypothetical protein NP493_299g02011 [Ridgeia piscesae]